MVDFDLNEEQSDAGLLLNACRELLVRLERFLLGRQMAVQHIEFSFFHLQMPATHLGLGCVQADRAVQHWFDLLELKFERLALPEPVIAIRLCAGQGQSFTAETDTLQFSPHDRQRAGGSITHLAERLSAHIGGESVHGVMTVAEHRPQYAWQAHSSYDDVPHCRGGSAFYVDPHAPELLAEIRRTNSLVLQRPLWILKEPQLLDNGQEGPCYHGPLSLQVGPERLETGWWDADGIARDYFVAVNPQGVHLWIYQDRGRETGCWYLHGMFG
jgi:protein ImuB